MSCPPPDAEPSAPSGGFMYRVAKPDMPAEAVSNALDALHGRSVSSAGGWAEQLSQQLCELYEVPCAQPTSNGWSALVVALQAAGIGPGTCVIVPTMTMVALSNAVRFLGATPVFADNAPSTYNPGLVEVAIAMQAATQPVRALVICHTYGVPCDEMESICEWAAEQRLVLIEDICECVGVRTMQGRLVGTFGAFACASLYANKIVHGGDGGFVLARAPEVASVLRSLVNHGFTGTHHFLHKVVATNSKINGVGAAIAAGCLRRLPETIAQRARIASWYREELTDQLTARGWELMPHAGQGDTPWVFGVVAPSRKERVAVRAALARDGIETRDYFYPLHLQPCNADLLRSGRSPPESPPLLQTCTADIVPSDCKLPNAELAAVSGFYLPTYSELNHAAVAYICSRLLVAAGCVSDSPTGGLTPPGVTCSTAIVVPTDTLRPEVRVYDHRGRVQAVRHEHLSLDVVAVHLELDEAAREGTTIPARLVEHACMLAQAAQPEWPEAAELLLKRVAASGDSARTPDVGSVALNAPLLMGSKTSSKALRSRAPSDCGWQGGAAWLQRSFASTFARVACLVALSAATALCLVACGVLPTGWPDNNLMAVRGFGFQGRDQPRSIFDEQLELASRLKQCVHSLAEAADTTNELELAPYVFMNRRQVDVNDDFGRLLYCEALLPRLNHFVDVFLFSGSGSTWTIAQALQHKAAAARNASFHNPAGQESGSPGVYSVTGWEGSVERYRLAQANLESRFPEVKKDLRHTVTLAREEGECNYSWCDLPHQRPLKGNLLNFCRERALSVDVSVHDGDVSHGLHDYDEWVVLNSECRPAVVNIFNSNIHPAHQRMVAELDSDPAWRRIVHGWVSFERHPRFKNRTYHAYVHMQRYQELRHAQGGHDAARAGELSRPPSVLHQGSSRSKQFRGRRNAEMQTSAPQFDMLTIMRTPTCVNYATVMNSIEYLTEKGLRKVWVVAPAKWLSDLRRWHSRVHAVDQEFAVAGVNLQLIEQLLQGYGFVEQGNSSRVVNGRSTAGWFLVQAINLGFVLRDDVLDTLLVHDADMVVLPKYNVFASSTFVHNQVERPKMDVKVGGVMGGLTYSYAHFCLTGENMLYHGSLASIRELSRRKPKLFSTGAFTTSTFLPHEQTGSFVTHSYTVFKPFMREMLSQFVDARFPPGFGRPSASGFAHDSALWLQNIIRCLNPERPDFGFGEIGSYLSWVLTHHPDAHNVVADKTWARYPPNPAIQKMRAASDGFCCPQPMLAGFDDELEFTGVELGHPVLNMAVCGYVDWNSQTVHSGSMSRSAYFVDSPYPPANNAFWASRGVSWSAVESGG